MHQSQRSRRSAVMHLMPEREVPGSSSAYLSRVSVSLQAGRDAAREKGQPEIVWAASLHLLSPPQEASISSHPFCSVPGNAPFIYWQRPLPPQPSFRPSAASPNCSTTRSHSVRYRPPSLVSHFSAFLKDGSARVGQGPCLSRCFCGRKNSRLQLLVVGAGRLLVRGISSPQTMLVSSSIVARGCVGLRAWKGLLQWTAAAPRIRAA